MAYSQLPLDEQRRDCCNPSTGRMTCVVSKSKSSTTSTNLPEAIFVDMFGDPEHRGRLGRDRAVRRSESQEGEILSPTIECCRHPSSEISALSGQFKPAESKALPADYIPPRTI